MERSNNPNHNPLAYSQDEELLRGRGYSEAQLQLIETLRDKDSQNVQGDVQDYLSQVSAYEADAGKAQTVSERKAQAMYYHADARRLKVIKEDDVASEDDYKKGGIGAKLPIQKKPENGRAQEKSASKQLAITSKRFVGKKAVSKAEKPASASRKSEPKAVTPATPKKAEKPASPSPKSEPKAADPAEAKPSTPKKSADIVPHAPKTEANESGVPADEAPSAPRVHKIDVLPEGGFDDENRSDAASVARALPGFVYEGSIKKPDQTPEKTSDSAPDHLTQEFLQEHRLVIDLEDGKQIVTSGNAIWLFDPKNQAMDKLATLEEDETLPAIEPGKPWKISGETTDGKTKGYESPLVTGFRILSSENAEQADQPKASEVQKASKSSEAVEPEPANSSPQKKTKEKRDRSKKRFGIGLAIGVLAASGIAAGSYEYYDSQQNSHSAKDTDNSDQKKGQEKSAKTEEQSPGSDILPSVDPKSIDKFKQTKDEDGNRVDKSPKLKR